MKVPVKDFIMRNKKAAIIVLSSLVFFCAVLIAVFAMGGAEEEETVSEISETESSQITIIGPSTETPQPEPKAEPIIEEEEEPDLSGLGINNLTGLYISEEAARRRPVAITINNRHIALPQSGIAQADLLYEVLAEGDITRFLAVFKEFDSERTGPVRSTRDYYGSLAMEHDSIFIHHGGSDGGYIFIKTHKLDAIDGMRDAKAFWRDPIRASTPSMLEHSSYTNAERIFASADERGFRMLLDEENLNTPFNFYDELTTPENSEPVLSVTAAFSHTQKPEFVFSEQEGVFYRFQAGGPHIDEEIGAQLVCSNIIIQQTTMRVIDTAGRRAVDLISAGDGFLITNGAYTPITWKKTSQNSPTEYYDLNGDKLTVNKGKTWILIISPSSDITFALETETTIERVDTND